MQTCAVQRCGDGVKTVCVPVTFSTGGTYEEKQSERARETAPAEPKVNSSPDPAVFSLSVFDFYSFLLDECPWHQYGINALAPGTVPVVVQGNACCKVLTVQEQGRRSVHVDTVVHVVPDTSREQERGAQLNLKVLEPKLPVAHPSRVLTATGTQ